MLTVGPLSDFIAPEELGAANLLKIDVQGFELEVLKSAESLLPRLRWIYAECSFVPLYEAGQALADEVTAFILAERGFLALSGRSSILPAIERGGALLQMDFLFRARAGRTLGAVFQEPAIGGFQANGFQGDLR